MITVKETQVDIEITDPIIQAPPVTNATTGFGPSIFSGKYRSNL